MYSVITFLCFLASHLPLKTNCTLTGTELKTVQTWEWQRTKVVDYRHCFITGLYRAKNKVCNDHWIRVDHIDDCFTGKKIWNPQRANPNNCSASTSWGGNTDNFLRAYYRCPIFCEERFINPITYPSELVTFRPLKLELKQDEIVHKPILDKKFSGRTNIPNIPTLIDEMGPVTDKSANVLMKGYFPDSRGNAHIWFLVLEPVHLSSFSGEWKTMSFQSIKFLNSSRNAAYAHFIVDNSKDSEVSFIIESANFLLFSLISRTLSSIEPSMIK